MRSICDEQLGVANDVDEQNVANLEFQIGGRFGSHAAFILLPITSLFNEAKFSIALSPL